MRTTAVTIFCILIVTLASSAQADLYLRLLHNNSASTVTIDAKTPWYWDKNRRPKYPISVKSHHSVFDVSVRDEALYKLCRKEISNVAVPEDCADKNPSDYLSISFPAKKVYYRISTCNSTIRVFTKRSKNNWPLSHVPRKLYGQMGNIFYFDVVTDDGTSIEVDQALGTRVPLSQRDRHWHRYVDRR